MDSFVTGIWGGHLWTCDLSKAQRLHCDRSEEVVNPRSKPLIPRAADRLCQWSDEYEPIMQPYNYNCLLIQLLATGLHETYLLIRHTSSSSQCLWLLSVLLMVAIPEDVQGDDLPSALKESIALLDYYTHTPHVISGSATPPLLCRKACLIGLEVIQEYLHHDIWCRNYVWWHLRNHVWCHSKDSWLVIGLECVSQHIYKQGTEGLSVKCLKLMVKNGTPQVAGRLSNWVVLGGGLH